MTLKLKSALVRMNGTYRKHPKLRHSVFRVRLTLDNFSELSEGQTVNRVGFHWQSAGFLSQSLFARLIPPYSVG